MAKRRIETHASLEEYYFAKFSERPFDPERFKRAAALGNMTIVGNGLPDERLLRQVARVKAWAVLDKLE
jgi:hypothetical protein